MFSLIYAWINDWVNNREAGDLRRHRGHYDVTLMLGMNSIPSRDIAAYSESIATVVSPIYIYTSL